MFLYIYQLKIEDNPDTNIAKVTGATKSLNNAIIFLPELFTTGYNYELIEKTAVNYISFLNKLPQNNIYIATIARYSEGKFFNAFFVKHQKNITFVYNKMHLFPLFEEEKFFERGEKYGVFNIDDTLCGASICFDLRFPDMYKFYREHNCKIVFLPCEWPACRYEHLDILSRARAIENQYFFVVANSVGESYGVEYAGGSCVIDPWGEKQVFLNKEQDVLISYKINLNIIESVRKKIPLNN